MSQSSLSTRNVELFQQGLAQRIGAQWEKGPVILQNVVREPIFAHSEFMGGLRNATREHLQSPTISPWRMFVDGKPAAPEQLQSLAVQADVEPFEDYAKRLKNVFPKQDISIILDRCEKHIPQLRRLLTPLLHDLFSIVGYPARINHTCLYAGKYHTTPTGIHKDPCHVLMFCGIGRKAMAFWPHDYFDSESDHVPNSQVSEHLKDALILEITPRDVLYWPADYWHVSVSEADQFNAAISLGIYHRGSSVEQFLSTGFLKKQSHTSWVKDYPSLDIHGIHIEVKGSLSPGELYQTDLRTFIEHWDRIRQILSKPGECESQVLTVALELTTSAGFGRLLQAPPMSPRNLAGAKLFCEIPQSLITAVSRDGVLVGANGIVSSRVCEADLVDGVVEQLRTGNEVAFDTLLASLTSDGQMCIETVLREAIEAGAIYPRSSEDAIPS